MKIAIIHGPNINFLGTREPEIYGSEVYESVKTFIDDQAEQMAQSAGINLELTQLQTNHEGEIIDFLQKCHKENFNGIVINPGALSHYSYAIADAVAGITPPVIEAHLTNIFAREEHRHKSVIAPVCKGQITGFGADSYVLSISQLIKLYTEEHKEG